MRVNQTAASSSAIASMGGYGCTMYECNDKEKEYSPDRKDAFVTVVQAYEETTISAVDSCWDAPADVDGLVIPAGQCLYIKAKSVTILNGYGVLYYEIET